MALGRKTGGRQPGSLNKINQQAAEIMLRMNCDPVEGMIRIAKNPKYTPELRGKMYAELAKYRYPTRKAIDATIHGPGDGPVKHRIEVVYGDAPQQ